MLTESDAGASGVARIALMESFKASLEDDAGELSPLIEWLLEAPLSMAAFLERRLAATLALVFSDSDGTGGPK